MDPRAVDIWDAGVAAVGGHRATQTALNGWSEPPPDRIVAIGKAASEMARAALERFGPLPALVVTKDAHARDLADHVEVIEAAHPVPDDRSLIAGGALIDAVQDMEPGTRLLLLVSGGASSLAEAPVPGWTLAELQALNTRLLSQGLDIAAMNAQRRKLSRIKGGGLLRGFRGLAVRVLAISDVPGDDLAVIGSGIGCPPSPCAFDHHARIVASNAVARLAAVDRARALDLPVLRNAQSLHDDLNLLAVRIGADLRTMPPGVMVLGGEPTVVLPPEPGRGGRNQALALALAREIAGIGGLTVVVGGTDGSDGPTDAAGGVIDGSTWGQGADRALARADSGSYLAQKDAQLVTGATGTNVMDLLIALRN